MINATTFLLPVLGFLLAVFIDWLLPKSHFRGSAILPLFLIPACQILTNQKRWPSFLPYGFLLFFVLVIVVSIKIAIQNKNLPLWPTLLKVWDYLVINTIFWFLGLLILVNA